MLRNPPYKVLGVELWACHGLPALVTLLSAAAVALIMWETASHYVKPVTLTAIWAEPRQITVAEIMAQTPDHGALHVYKNGYWSRLCSTTAEQTFIDEQGTISARVLPHKVDVPKTTGAFATKQRPKGVLIPQELAMKVKFSGKPVLYRFKIENKSDCPMTFFPITNAGAEAAFEIIP